VSGRLAVWFVLELLGGLPVSRLGVAKPVRRFDIAPKTPDSRLGFAFRAALFLIAFHYSLQQKGESVA